MVVQALPRHPRKGCSLHLHRRQTKFRRCTNPPVGQMRLQPLHQMAVEGTATTHHQQSGIALATLGFLAAHTGGQFGQCGHHIGWRYGFVMFKLGMQPVHLKQVAARAFGRGLFKERFIQQ